MGRATIVCSVAEFADILRGASWSAQVEVPRADPVDPARSMDSVVDPFAGMIALIEAFRQREYGLMDLSTVTVLRVVHDVVSETVHITVAGPDLPAWAAGEQPATIRAKVQPLPSAAPKERHERVITFDGE